MGNLEEKGFEIRYCEDTFRLYLRSIGFFYRMLDRRLAIMALKNSDLSIFIKFENF
jgi:hypothetical protein